MPAKADARERRTKAPESRFRRPPAELVARAARRLVRGDRASFGSQAEFRAAVLDLLRREEPKTALGGARLRRVVLEVPGVRMSVRYTERPSSPLPHLCPVCGSELRPIRNRTLTGETILLGRRCVRCAYWTHASRRVPVRYAFSKVSVRSRRSALAVP